MSNPKVPPHIAKQIAALKAAAPAPRPAGAAPAAPVPQAKAPPPKAAAAAPPRPAKPAGPGMPLIHKVAIGGWALAAVACAAGYWLYSSAESRKQGALAEQAASYDAQIAQLKAESAAALKNVQDAAAAQQVVLQTELDFAKLPEIPLETVFRANQVLYVESRLDEPFTCKIRLSRPIGAVTREVDFTIKARTFQDLAAIDTWLFAKGDRVEFVKPGFKPRTLVVP